MRKLFILLFVVSAIGLQTADMSGQSNVKKRMTVEADQWLPDGGLEALWAKADTVVLGRVEARSKTLRRDSRAPEVAEPVQNLDVAVEEVFKEYPSVKETRSVKIEQIAGTVEDDTTVYIVPPSVFAPLRVGARYVLFLARNRVANRSEFVLPFGPSGVFLLAEGRVFPQGKSFSGVATDVELLTLLRSLRAHELKK